MSIISVQSLRLACTVYTVRKEMKCSVETEILYELVHETTLKSENHELICVISRFPRYTFHFFSNSVPVSVLHVQPVRPVSFLPVRHALSARFRSIFFYQVI